MPAPKDGRAQNDKNDHRKFITIRVGSNGRVAYRKVYLRTKDRDIARQRARALIDIQDPQEARRIVAYLAGSHSPEVEKRRIAELTQTGPTIPSPSMEEARRELEGIVCPWTDHAPGALDGEIVEEWRAAINASDQLDILVQLGVPEHCLRDDPDLFTDIKPRSRKLNPDFKPREAVLKAALGLPIDRLPEDKPARGPRLSACIDEFRIDQEQRGNSDRHVKAYLRSFESFVNLLKDKRIQSLKKADFVKYLDHVIEESKGLSNKTIRDRLKPIEVVLETARARMEDRVFPEGLDGFVKVLQRERRKRIYKPPRKNREPMPPKVFRTLLAKADEWAKLDWEAYAASLPVPDEDDGRRRVLQRNKNIKIAKTLKRAGMMGHSMLCLAANVGACPIDFCRLRWSELVLDGELPLYREDRSKPAHLLGDDVPRCCPLLPETVRSLKRWQEHRQAEIEEYGLKAPEHTQFVFTNSDRKPFGQKDSSGVSKILGRPRQS